MAKDIVLLFFAFGFLDGELEFALNFAHKEIIDDDVVGRVVQFVLDPYQPKLILHLLVVVQDIHSLEQTDEFGLAALELRSHKVSHSEHH